MDTIYVYTPHIHHIQWILYTRILYAVETTAHTCSSGALNMPSREGGMTLAGQGGGGRDWDWGRDREEKEGEWEKGSEGGGYEGVQWKA